MDAGPFKGAEKGNHEHEYRQGSGRQQDTADHGNRIEKSGDGAQGEVVHGLFFDGEEKAGGGQRNGQNVYQGLCKVRFYVEIDASFFKML